MTKTKIARQKIVNTKNEIITYELLYRNESLSQLDDISKTADVISTFLLNKESISNNLPVSINFTNSNLLDTINEIVDPNGVIIEILENVTIDSSFLEKIMKLKEMGFKVALDDFDYSKIEDLNVFDYVDVLKVDFRSSTKEELLFVETLAKKYSNLTLLAEKVETKEEYEYAIHSGYSLFQGYFISKPEELIFDVE